MKFSTDPRWVVMAVVLATAPVHAQVAQSKCAAAKKTCITKNFLLIGTGGTDPIELDLLVTIGN